MHIDLEQQQAINTHGSCIVRAGAGSGKTKVLTEHYMQLVSSDYCSVAEIVALTFTRKAAAEMHQRIFQLLVQASADAPDLAQFHDATITTLDSYCLRIVRNAHTLFPFKSEPRIDHVGYEELLEHAAFRTLQRYAHKGYFSWANTFSISSLHGFLNNLLIFLDRHYLPCTKLLDIEKMIALQKQYLAEQKIALSKRFLSAHAAALSCSPQHGLCQQIAGIAIPTTLSDTDISNATAPSSESDRALLDAYALLSLLRVKRKAPDAEQLKDATRQLRSIAKQLISIDDYCRHFANNPSMYDIIVDFQRRLNRQKMQHGIFNYNNILELAIAVLLTDNAYCSYLRKSVRAILVDEFQDNNVLQKNLLYLLAGANRTGVNDPFQEIPFPYSSPIHLFLVGDDKQSIYRFRGANVHLFNAMYQQFKEHDREQVELRTNYRTHSFLLQHINNIFSHIFPPENVRIDNIERDSSADEGQKRHPADTLSTIYYSSANAYWQTAPQYASQRVPFISLDYYLPDNENVDVNPAYHEAIGIAEKIKCFMLDSHLRIFAQGGYRRAEYNDFAILFRARKNIAVIERALREQGIPYRKDDSVILDDSPVHDVHSLLFLAFCPQSSQHYASVLRSPWVNCSDAAVQIIISESLVAHIHAFAVRNAWVGEDQLATDLNVHLATLRQKLDSDDYQKYHNACMLFHQLRRRMVHATSASVIDFLWYEWGYSYWLLNALGKEQESELYSAFHNLAMQSPDLMQLLTSVKKSLAQKSFWHEHRSSGENSSGYLAVDRGVSLLTIHQAKGLEFPVVFLAQSSSAVGGERSSTVSYDYQLKYSFKVAERNAIFDLRRDDRELHEGEELKRLLYVALTRAQSHLFISAHTSREKESRQKKTLWDLVVSSEALTPNMHRVQEELPVAPPADAPTSAESLEHDELHRYLTMPPATISANIMHIQATAFSGAVYAVNASSLEEAQPRVHDNASDTTPPASPIPVAGMSEHHAPLLHSLPVDKVADITGSQFGTACHHLLSRIVTARLDLNNARARVFLEQCVARDFPELHGSAEWDMLLDSLKKVGEYFFSSELYTLVSKAAHTFCERPFILQQDIEEMRYVIHGVVDLVCVDEARKSMYVIDYKSDQIIDMERYVGQIGCYVAAITELYDYSVTAMLYAIRNGVCYSIPTEYACGLVSDARYYQEFCKESARDDSIATYQ